MIHHSQTPVKKGDVLIDFPEVRQSTNYTCGVSALQALLYYYGISYREDN